MVKKQVAVLMGGFSSDRLSGAVGANRVETRGRAAQMSEMHYNFMINTGNAT